MTAALVDASALLPDEKFIWQLALWPPDRAVPFARTARVRHLQVVVHPVMVQSASQPVAAPGTFPCTWPGCSRGPLEPFPTAAQLANHRFAAHGIRSSNEESIARQTRRDRKRALERGTPPPEYIDVVMIRASVQQFLPIKLPPEIREGALDAGEREQIRRRLCYHVQQWMHEYRRAPADITVAIAQIAASGLTPTGLAARVLNPEEALSNAPRARLQAIARGRKRSGD